MTLNQFSLTEIVLHSNAHQDKKAIIVLKIYLEGNQKIIRLQSLYKFQNNLMSKI